MKKNEKLLLGLTVLVGAVAFFYYKKNKNNSNNKSEEKSEAVGANKNYGKPCSTAVRGDAPNNYGTYDSYGRCRKNRKSVNRRSINRNNIMNSSIMQRYM